MDSAHAEIRRLERQERQERRRIKKIEDLHRSLIDAADLYVLACSRVQVLLVELERADRRNDKEAALGLVSQVKDAFAEKLVREKAERKANERFTRFTAKLAAERSKTGPSE